MKFITLKHNYKAVVVVVFFKQEFLFFTQETRVQILKKN